MINIATGIQPLSSENPQECLNYLVECHPHCIHTVVTAKPSVVKRWLFRIHKHHAGRIRRRRMVVGVGVQWTPLFGAGTGNPAATLQLCIGHSCLSTNLVALPMCRSVFGDSSITKNITFVGFWNGKDNARLRLTVHRLSFLNLIDLRDVASDRKGCSKSLSIQELASSVLAMKGLENATWFVKCNWDAYSLTEAQVEYTCIDAFLSFSIGAALKVWNWQPESRPNQ